MRNEKFGDPPCEAIVFDDRSGNYRFKAFFGKDVGLVEYNLCFFNNSEKSEKFGKFHSTDLARQSEYAKLKMWEMDPILGLFHKACGKPAQSVLK